MRTRWQIVRLFNLRHLHTRRRRTALTVVGISASVALIVAISLINETLRTAIDGTTRGLAGEASLEVAPVGVEPLSSAALAEIGAAPGVAATVPISQQITTLRGGKGARKRTFVFGVPRDLAALFLDGLGELGDQMAHAEFRRGALLSPTLAEALGAGDTAVLRTAGGPRSVEVVGVVEHSPFAAVNGGNFALLSLGRSQRLFGQPGEASVAYVTLLPGEEADSVRADLQRRLGRAIAVRQPGGGAVAYRRTFDSIAAISEQARAVGFLVALFLVLNTMSMCLAERRKEIAILTLNGARRRDVMAAFVIEATLLGAAGSVLGVAAGIGVASLLVQQTAASYTILPFVSSGSLVIELSAIALGVAAGTSVAIAGAILPARRILRAEPISALRPEASYEWRSRPVARSGLAALAGAALLAGAACVAAFTPIGAHDWLVALALTLALAGTALLLPALVPASTSAMRRTGLAPFGIFGRLAGDALLRNPTRATITAGALALSAAVVIAVSSGIGSYNREVARAASAWYVAPLYVNAPGSAAYTSDQPLPGLLRRRLSEVAGVRAAYPIRFDVADDRGRQMIVYAMPIAEAARAGDRITEGVGISQRALTMAMQRGEIVMSRYMARRRDLRPGDMFTLPNAPRGGSLRIAGLFNDVATFDSLYLELRDYRRLTGDDGANRFAVVTEPGADDAIVARNLRRYLSEKRIPGSVLDRADMRAEVVDSIAGLFSLAKGMQVAALLIAGLIILNTMLTATFERRREFGLQRMIGMSRGQLAGSVMLESVAISAIGAAYAILLGLGLGFLMTLTIESQLAWRIAYVPALPTLFATVLATLAIGALAALYPGWQATRQRLIELVQYE